MPTHNGRVTEPDAKPEAVDKEATEYVRTLDDTQLVGLALDVDRRTRALLAQGVPLPMQEIENHHIIGLLECFIGPEESMRVREYHLSWLDRRLDMAEAAVRMQLLNSGLFDDAADLPEFP